ncbi:MAG TPA: response regulator [Candidatus Acidoferrum sp.]|nr:response regulator [Candidatus Acidoferrum sp.]
MSTPKVLVVDDQELLRVMLQEALEINGFEVVTAAGVNEALRCIAAGKFDVLISDLHMPDKGDGLTVVSAMRNAHPEAVTLVYSGYPEMDEATNAILLQADQILVKPLKIQDLMKIIRENLASGSKAARRVTENVATILESESDAISQLWLSRVQENQALMKLPLSSQERTGHLALLLRDLVARLRRPNSVEAKHPDSKAAHEHGRLRREQGYSAPLIVEESRMLQVSIFQILQNNLARVDFSVVLVDVMTIADEVDSQLCQAMQAFSTEPDPVVLVA